MAAAKPPRAPRHVNLRSQQRRLRHIRSLAIRNIFPPEPILWDSLSVSVRFTLHDLESNKDVIYTSSALQETYNPTWGSLSFTHEAVGKHFILNKFLIKVWFLVVSRSEELFCFEKVINLAQYIHLGMAICCRDQSNFPNNSIIVGTSEGYYCSPETGGVPSPYLFNHYNELINYLPRNSLIEVKKSEINDSYNLKDLQRLIDQQKRLTMLRQTLKEDKRQIAIAQQKQIDATNMRTKHCQLKTHVELLRKQLEQQRKILSEERERLNNLRSSLDNREKLLSDNQKRFAKSKTKFENDSMLFSHRREQFIKNKKQLHLRQRTLISELAETFCIKQLNDTFTICDVILPHGDPMESGASSADQTGVALGFVCHLVHLLAQFLLIPLQYPIQPVGSRSMICDNYHDGLDVREFPLFIRGTEKALYQFGLYLLWRDILQLRQHCGYGNSKANAKKTLFNLKNLLDKLMMDKYSIFPLKESSVPSISIMGPTTTSSFEPLSSPLSQLLLDPSESSHERSVTPTSCESPNGILLGQEEEWSPAQSPRLRSSPLVDRSHSPVLFRSTSPRSRQNKLSFELVQTEQGSFQLSESPSNGTVYTLDVPRPFSNADRVLTNLPVDDLPPVTCHPPFHSQFYSNSDPQQFNSDTLRHRSEFPQLEPQSHETGSQTNVRTNSDVLYSNIRPELSLVSSMYEDDNGE